MAWLAGRLAGVRAAGRGWVAGVGVDSAVVPPWRNPSVAEEDVELIFIWLLEIVPELLDWDVCVWCGLFLIPLRYF